ncbi:MAG TPA: tripartite tricarboxylate transporter substrate binding protein [Burkholderiales bacterium]|nr:tripartite tricarboxylate transporter substrate binding protein [Burkholderiales bacterium]
MRSLVAVALTLVLAGAAWAQPYPAKPVRFIVSFPPGGSADVMVRLVAPRLAERLGQQFVVENRAGAGGNIGVDAVAKAAPDGHTIGLAAAGALSVNPHLYPSMPFDPQKDLAPISALAMIPFFLIAHPTLPAKDLRELIALARSRPGDVSFGHGGQGSAMHLSGELLNLMAEIKLQAVPYKGSAPVATDVLGGQIPLGVTDVPSAIAHIRAGKIKALAVTTRQRIDAAPEVPTFHEAGVPGYESIGWFGAVAPAGTPARIVELLAKEMAAALQVPEIRSRVLATGMEPFTNTPQEFAAMIRDESRKWAQVIKTAKVTLN